MSLRRQLLPLFLTLATPAIFVAVAYSGMQRNVGPVCDLDEDFVAPGRPVYQHHCKCLGWRYPESPPAVPGSNATRCFGRVLRRWTDTNEAALAEKKAGQGKLFERLAPEAQERIRAAYRLLQQAAYRNDYPLMLAKAREILTQVDDYGEARALEALAKSHLEGVPAEPLLNR